MRIDSEIEDWENEKNSEEMGNGSSSVLSGDEEEEEPEPEEGVVGGFREDPNLTRTGFPDPIHHRLRASVLSLSLVSLRGSGK